MIYDTDNVISIDVIAPTIRALEDEDNFGDGLRRQDVKHLKNLRIMQQEIIDNDIKGNIVIRDDYFVTYLKTIITNDMAPAEWFNTVREEKKYYAPIYYGDVKYLGKYGAAQGA